MLTSDLFKCNRPISPVPGNSRTLVDDEVLIGVEVESENCGIDIDKLQGTLRYWDTKTDGSLKSPFPYEFVVRNPIQGPTLEAALQELHDTLEGTSAAYPHNTSVHIHVDVSSLTLEELRSFVYLSISLESALVKISGDRRDNVYCMPYGKSDGRLLSALGKMLNGELSSGHATTWHSKGKYATVNFTTVSSLGTVEFRTHVGTHNKDAITEWINVILRLRQFAVNSSNSGDPRDVLDYTSSRKTLTEYLGQVWPERTVRKMLHKNLHRDVRASSFMARLSLFPKTYDEFRAWASGLEYTPPKNYEKKETRKVYSTHTAIDWNESEQYLVQPNLQTNPFAHAEWVPGPDSSDD